MYLPRLLKGKAAPKDNYNKDIIFILLLPFHLFPYPSSYSFLLPLKSPSFLFPLPSFFFFPLSFFLFLPFPSPLLFLLNRCIYRPKKTNPSSTRNL